MDKVYKVVNTNEPSSSGTQLRITDWNKCVLCQKDTDEALTHPYKSARRTDGAGYRTLADHLVAFDKINCLPRTLKLSQLDEGQGIEAAFRAHNATWHDSCRLQFNKTKLQRAEKRQMQQEDRDDNPDTRKFTRQSIEGEHQSMETCFFCGKSASRDPLHNASTFDLDIRVRQCALKLQDKLLLSKLSAGDLIAQEAKYHAQCLASLYNKARDTKIQESNEDTVNHGIAFAGLVAYIEEVRMDTVVAPVFKLADLVNLYSTRLEQLGTHVTGRIHSTKLKDRILAYFPDMKAHKQGRDVVLVCNEDVGAAFRKACDHDADNDAVHLSKAANIVRKEMFKMKQQFNGSFGDQCEVESVPVSLLALVSMVLYGPNITTQYSSACIPQPAVTISQLLVYNSLVNRRPNAATSRPTTRHCQDRETPLPIYLGIMIHTKTRKRALVDTLFDLGLSISYDRVLDISTELGNKISHYYEVEKAVCPPKLRSGLFTTAAVDNIDHNPTSTSAHDSFHGTGISLFQHPDIAFPGIQRNIAPHKETPQGCPSKKTAQLPCSYTNVPPVALMRHDPAVPKIEGPNKSDCQLMHQAMREEYRWLEHTEAVLVKDNLQGDETVSWAAHHASLQLPNATKDGCVMIPSLLPLFYDQAKSVAMIRHSMDVVKQAVEILNPGQVPIITVDQPLYSVAKQIQWSWAGTHGEDQFIVMFGGLHIEMAALKTLGDLLDGSGWAGALVQAGIATTGTADSFLKASHVTRTRRAHQVTASSLYILLRKAHAEYTNNLGEGDAVMSLEDWCAKKAESCPQFHFWYIILQLELEVMVFVRSIREANFLLYIDSLTKIVPWFFALGHTNYARWIPVHLRDMIALKHIHPDVHSQFLKGNFVVHKTIRSFSCIAIDQAHEQNNASVKGDGGAVGLTENAAALRRWMVSGPEMARLIGEFEASTEKRMNTDTRHHEQTKHAQMAFARDVRSLTGVIEDMGNPFCESSGDLLVLNTRDIVDAAVIDSVNKIEKLGQEQYSTFVSERLVTQTTPIKDSIKRNNLSLFSRPSVREKTKFQQQLSSMKNDCSLFSRLYIVSQTREGDLDNFFAHENQAYPPALSQMGKMRTGTKSDLVECLEDLIPSNQNVSSPTVKVTILDGAAIVNMLRPGAAKTFLDYAQQVFLPYILSQLQHVERVDIVWDEYLPDSLKYDTRSKRGKGVRRRVDQSSDIPGNWAEFLRINDNKTELFSFLATSVASLDHDKQIITTHHTDVICNYSRDVTGIAPCTHEEADTRILLHVKDAVNEGYTTVSIRTVDTDVLVLAVTAAHCLNITELWVAFGTGKSYRYLAAHEMARALGPDRCIALPMFHAFTGCDTVSSFCGRGKKTAWNIWATFNEVTRAFCALATTPNTMDEWIDSLERFVVLLYDRTSSLESVNQARKQLFTQKGRDISGLPPTQAALLQHTKRAVYQAAHCWGQMMVAVPELPSPEDWGWKKRDARWEVVWTMLPEATDACRELLRCGCTKGCRAQCKCRKAELQCTALCHCGGLCSLN